MFEGFAETTVDVADASIFVRHGGDGPPILLLHGHPRTSATWHRVAPRLVRSGHTVVCPDLRGYGRSVGPDPAPDHSNYAKRPMADDMVQVMHRLGHDRFVLVGHDRGSYVALRLALDQPASVEALVLMDSIPISEHLDRVDSRFATSWWHWFFFAQAEIPERVITADPDSWYRADPVRMGEENYAEFRNATRNPRVVRAMLEDYRAGLTIDAEHERADRRAGRKLEMPLLALWSERDDLVDLDGDPLVIWQHWATDLRGHGIDSGHHMAEDAPAELTEAIVRFLTQRTARR